MHRHTTATSTKNNNTFQSALLMPHKNSLAARTMRPFLMLLVIAATAGAQPPKAPEPATKEDVARLHVAIDELNRTTAKVVSTLEKLDEPDKAAVVYTSRLGMIPNDGKDDTLALLSAFNGKTGFKIVFDQRGTFNLNASIPPDVSVTFEGPCGGTTSATDGVEIEPVSETQTEPCLRIGAHGGNASGGIVVRGLVFSGGRTRHKATGLSGETATTFVVEQCKFYRLAKGVSLVPVGRLLAVAVRDCQFSDCDVCLDVDGNADQGRGATTAGLNIENCNFDAGDIALRLAPPFRTTRVVGCVAQAQKHASFVQDGGYVSWDTNYGENRSYVQNGRKVWPPSLMVKGTGQAFTRNCSWNGCYVDRNAGAFIKDEGSRDNRGDAASGQILPIPHNELPREVQ